MKEILLKYEVIWSHIRKIKRKLDALGLDRIHYAEISSITNKKKNVAAKEFADRVKEICTAIENYARNIHQVEIKISDDTTLIPTTDIQMLSNMGDQMGKVFLYKGNIYRGIFEQSKDDFVRIWSQGVLQGLADCNIVPNAKIADFRTEEFPIVLSVEKVYMQKNTFWGYSMVVDACVLISLLYVVLQKYNLTLCDGHLNNVSFNKGKPIFVDIGSIIPKRPTGAMEELSFSGLYRLLFGLLGNCMLYRFPSHDGDNFNIYIKPRFYNQYTREYRYCLKKFKRLMFTHGGIRKYTITHKMFDLYDIKPEYIKLLFDESHAYYSEIKHDIWDTFSTMVDWEGLKGCTVVDTGGTYPIINNAIKKGCHFKFVKFLDFNEKRLDHYYRDYSEYAEVSFGLVNYIYLQSEEQIAKLKSEAVFCLNPCLNNSSFQGINISSITYALHRLGMKYAIVFVDLSKDKEMRKYYNEFITSLGNYYALQEKSRNDLRCIIGRRI